MLIIKTLIKNIFNYLKSMPGILNFVTGLFGNQPLFWHSMTMLRQHTRQFSWQTAMLHCYLFRPTIYNLLILGTERLNTITRQQILFLKSAVLFTDLTSRVKMLCVNGVYVCEVGVCSIFRDCLTIIQDDKRSSWTCRW